MSTECAVKGNAVAQTNLGLMYFNGQGVTKSLSEAQRYFKLAADQGYAEGLLRLGQMYLSKRYLLYIHSLSSSHFIQLLTCDVLLTYDVKKEKE
jgi:TPR repeat protein